MTRFILSLFLFLPTFFHAQSEGDYLDLAEQAQQDNHYKKAIKYISKAIELDTSNALFYAIRGRMIAGLTEDNKQLEYIDNQSFINALADLNKAIDLEPYNPDFYQSRGILYLNFRKYKEAFLDFDQQLKYVGYLSEELRAMCWKAKAKFRSKEIDASFRILEEALKMDSTNLHVLNDLSLQYMRLKEFEIARFYLNKAMAVNSEDKMTFANMGYLALRSGKYEQALKIYDSVIELYPEVGLLYNNRGFLKYKFDRFEDALKDVNYSIELAPANSYAYKNRALIYLSTNQKEKACEDLLYAKSLGYTLDYDDEVIELLIEHCLKVNQKIDKKE